MIEDFMPGSRIESMVLIMSRSNDDTRSKRTFTVMFNLNVYKFKSTWYHKTMIDMLLLLDALLLSSY